MHLKVDEELISLVIGEISALDGEAIALQGRLDALKSAADEKVKQNAKKAKNALPEDSEEKPEYSKEEKEKEIDQAANGALVTIQADYNTASGAITNMQTLLGKLSGGLTKVLNAVTTFNEGVTINAALAEVQDGFKNAGLDVSIEIEMNANGGDTPVLYYTIDGKKYTLSELLNAFYTYTGMHMNTQIQADILMEQLGITDEDQKAKMRLGVTEQVNALTTFAADHRLYGLATEDDIKGFYEATTGAELDDKGNVGSLLENTPEGMDFAAILSQATGADMSDAAKVAAGAMGAFGLVSFLNTYKDKDLKEEGVFDDAAERVNTATEEANNPENETKPEEEATTEEETTTEEGQTGSESSETPTGPSGGSPYYPSSSGSPSSSGGDSGGGSGNGSGGGSGGSGGSSGSKSSGTGKSEIVAGSIKSSGVEVANAKYVKETEIPGIVKPVEGNKDPLTTPEDASMLPKEELPKTPVELEKDYDTIARMEYESQGLDAIQKHREGIIANANTLFDTNKDGLKAELRKYGYSDTDIETIIQDRNLTINAMVSGDERLELARKASELATKDGVTGYDTTYDNPQTITSLTDGTTEKLLANISSDEGVKKAYTELNTAEEKYTTANTAAITALAGVDTARTKLEEVTKQIESNVKTNPEQWDKKTLDAYNEEVTKLYNSRVKTVGGSIDKLTAKQQETLSKARSDATYSVAVARGADLTKWSSSQKAEYENQLTSINKKYVEKYGKDTSSSKWTADVKEQYTKERDAAYRKMAYTVGKSKLTEADKKTINSKVQKVKSDIINTNGSYDNWSAADKKAYEADLAALKEKYAAKASTATGEAVWTKEQAKQYNDAVAEYNTAVTTAKEAVANLDTAKAEYTSAKTNFATARDSFFAKSTNENQYIANNVSNNIVDAGTMNQNSGSKPYIDNIQWDENGATIGNGGNMGTNGNGELQPDSQTANAGEVIVNDDEAEIQLASASGIGITDAGGYTSGTISNDDIQI